MPRSFRHTKVVFTIGPATTSEEILEKLLNVGVDICRLNMAHASHEWTRETIATVRKVCDRVGRQIAFMMDVKGPEIRTGDVEETLHLEQGETFDLLIKEEARDPAVRGTTVNYPGLGNDVKVGDVVLVDSGLIRMQVKSVGPERIRCEVAIPGPMGNRRHINLPGVKVNLPCLTRKDRADIDIGIECGVDFYALSFVREPDDLDILRRFITERGSEAKIIAKIEDQSAISNLDQIIQASDGLMVARGDLGIEIPYETLPLVQHRAVKTCLRMGKPVIIATHMLASMITSPMPTRAEITDVATAVLEQSDCVMLSGETTVGKYPVECVDVLNRIIYSMEGEGGDEYNDAITLKTPKARMLKAAVVLAGSLEKSAIVAFSHNGYLIQMLSALRPRKTPIFAFTDVPRTFKHMLMLWGVEPFLLDFDEDPDTTIDRAVQKLVDKDWIDTQTHLIVITNVLASDGRIIDTIQMRSVK
ncbi:MAG: pyruvate kinase [Verrucomicrobiota bacterium]